MRSLLLLDDMSLSFPGKEKLLYGLIAAFFLSLFLPDMPMVSNLIIGAIMVQCTFFNTLTQKIRLLRERKAIWFMLLFFLLQILSAALSADHRYAGIMLARRTPLLLFPLSIGLLDLRPELKNRILLAFCWITAFVAVACLFHAFRHYYVTGDAQWLYDDSLTSFLGWQSSFMAMVVNLALFCWVYLLQGQPFSFRKKGLTYLAIVLLLVFHYLLASRIGIILLYSTFLTYAIWSAMSTRRYTRSFVWIIGAIATVGLFRLAFPKTTNRFKELQYTGYQYNSKAVESHYNMPVTPDQWNGANIRLAVWKCGLAVARRHWITGVPLGDKEQALMFEYQARHFDFAYRTKRDTHNTWLDVLINTGILGLAVFALGWTIFPFVECVRAKDGLGAVVVLTFAAVMLFETWIDRSLGCSLPGFFLSFTIAAHPSLSCLYNRTASQVSPK